MVEGDVLQLLGAPARRMCVLSGGEFAFMEAINTVNFQHLSLQYSEIFIHIML